MFKAYGSYLMLAACLVGMGVGCIGAGSAGTPAANGSATRLPTLTPTMTSGPTAVSAIATSTPTPTPEPTAAPATDVVDGDVFYVSRAGDDSNGRSWATAWSELDRINWDTIMPGSTILIDGGATQMTYQRELQIAKSGSPELPITIQLATEAGHNGQAIFFGGRTEPLPYCGQLEFDNDNHDTLFKEGIQTNDHDNLIIDGTKWRGIVIHGYQRNGIRVDRNSSNILVRYVEIYNNGLARQRDNGEWYSDQPGVLFGGKDITFQRVIIHDNGQDAFQSLWDQNNIQNFRLEQSWLFNGRKHPTVDESANYCTHTDGIQIYDGGTISGITITETIIGPGFTQGVILGQSLSAGGAWADVQDVTIRNTLFSKAADNAILGYRNTNSSNWVIDHVTLHCPKTKGHCLTIDQSNHSVTNTIVVGSRITFKDGLAHYEGNCQWETTGFQFGLEADPQFTAVSNTDHFSLDNYTLQPTSPCQGAGSNITSVEQLLDQD